MRFDRDVTFVKIEGEQTYNQMTGNFEVGSEVRTNQKANVNDLGADRVETLFGSLDVNAKVVRVLQSYPEFDYLIIDGTEYEQTTVRGHRNKHSFIVRERQ